MKSGMVNMDKQISLILHAPLNYYQLSLDAMYMQECPFTSKLLAYALLYSLIRSFLFHGVNMLVSQ